MDPLTLMILAGVGAIGMFAMKSNSASASDGTVDVLSAPPAFLAASGSVFVNQNFNCDLLDVDPSAQGGNYKRDYDDYFAQASVETGVPWALIKAHAIAESSLVPNASLTEPNGRKSYGLMQVLWWPSSQRFANWGYGDDKIGDGSILYDPGVSAYLGAMVMQDNLSRFGNLTDAINAYNTGVAASKRVAPFGYVDKVKKYYSALVGQAV